jgi:hypothetical protein
MGGIQAVTDQLNKESVPTPKCDQCGLEITTGMMAAYCPQAEQCEFWPATDNTPQGDSAELMIALLWIRNACEQIGLQIEDRKRLERERDEALSRFSEAQRDTARLDWLDSMNRRTNEHYGTTYGWRFDLNHNRGAMLADHHIPALSVREAIDEAMEAK